MRKQTTQRETDAWRVDGSEAPSRNTIVTPAKVAHTPRKNGALLRHPSAEFPDVPENAYNSHGEKRENVCQADLVLGATGYLGPFTELT